MTTPNPAAPTPGHPADDNTTPGPGTVDAALALRATTSGQWLAGHIALAMLDTVGTPTKLPHLLCPDIDPAIVDRVWNLALPVGYRAGQLAGAPRFHRDTLTRLQTALTDAGYASMAALGQQTLNLMPPPPAPVHPADDDTAWGHE